MFCGLTSVIDVGCSAQHGDQWVAACIVASLALSRASSRINNSKTCSGDRETVNLEMVGD